MKKREPREKTRTVEGVIFEEFFGDAKWDKWTVALVILLLTPLPLILLTELNLALSRYGSIRKFRKAELPDGDRIPGLERRPLLQLWYRCAQTVELDGKVPRKEALRFLRKRREDHGAELPQWFRDACPAKEVAATATESDNGKQSESAGGAQSAKQDTGIARERLIEGSGLARSTAQERLKKAINEGVLRPPFKNGDIEKFRDYCMKHKPHGYAKEYRR